MTYVHMYVRTYSGTSLIRTPEMRTPRFNGHFAQVRNLSHSLLYIFTSEMRTPRYSVQRTVFSVPIAIKLYKRRRFIQTLPTISCSK